MRLIIPLSEIFLVLFLPSIVHTDLHPCCLVSWCVLIDRDTLVATLLWDTESQRVPPEVYICIWQSTSHSIVWGVFFGQPCDVNLSYKSPGQVHLLLCSVRRQLSSQPLRGGNEMCFLLAQPYTKSTDIWDPSSMGRWSPVRRPSWMSLDFFFFPSVPYKAWNYILVSPHMMQFS